MTTEHNWQTPVAVLQNEMKHITEQLDDIKQSQSRMAADVSNQLGQMSGSVRRMEDKFVQVGAWKMAIVAFLPILGGVIGAKFTAITNFLGFK